MRMKPKLTSQQMAVARHVANGRTIKEAALAMRVSPKTVEFHFDRACKVLGIGGVRMVNLARWAIRNKMAPLCAVLAGCVLVLGGCAGAVTENHGGTQVRNPMPPLPPMPPVPMRSFAGAVGVMSRALTANGFTVQLEWNVYGQTAGIITGVRGSTNMVNWYELTNLPAASTVDVILEGRPMQMEFYRAFNRWAPK